MLSSNSAHFNLNIFQLGFFLVLKYKSTYLKKHFEVLIYEYSF